MADARKNKSRAMRLTMNPRRGFESFLHRSQVAEDCGASLSSLERPVLSSLPSIEEDSERALCSATRTVSERPDRVSRSTSERPDRASRSISAASAASMTSSATAPARLSALHLVHLASRSSVVANDLRLDDALRPSSANEEGMGGEEAGSEAPPQSSSLSERPVTQHERNAGKYTVIAFVNTGSGGGMGEEIEEALRSHLGADRVVDLRSCRPGNMPEDVLMEYAHDPNVRVLACGGDGTCGWIFSSLDRVWSRVLGQSSKSRVHASRYRDHLPLAIMPLGTGNDLSRQFGWGPGFQQEMKKKGMITMVQTSKLTHLDRWRCIIVPLETLSDEEKAHVPKILGESFYDVDVDAPEEEDPTISRTVRETAGMVDSLLREEGPAQFSTTKREEKLHRMIKPSTQLFDGVFCNYLSLGWDATIAYLFHHERETRPERFTSQFKNKVVYVEKAPYALKAPKLRKRLRIMVNNDKGELAGLKIPKSCRAVVLLNIQSIYSGNHLARGGHPSDGRIEVIFLSNVMRTIASCAAGPVMPFVLHRVAARTDNVCIRMRCPLHCQVDGEPWLQGEGVMRVKFHSRNSILERARDERMNCSCAGDGGMENAVIR